MRQHLTHFWLHKKQVAPGKMKMYSVTYNNIRLKCYIKFFYVAPHEVAGSPILARAINNFKSFLNELKKFKGYLFFSIYSHINSVTISLIVLCCLAAMIFNSVFKSESILAINLVSLIFITPYVICGYFIFVYKLIFIIYYNK